MKKIKYLMPCISLPLIASPAIALTGCSCKFNGKVSEAEFKSAIESICSTESRGKFQASTTFDYQLNEAYTLNFVVDGNTAIIKMNNKIIGGEFYDETANCKWQVSSSSIFGGEDVMLAEHVGNKKWTSVNAATGLHSLYELRTKFSSFTFSNKEYSYTDSTSPNTTYKISFNKNKKIEKISSEASAKTNASIKTETIFSYNDVSISTEEKAKLTPQNVHFGTKNGGTITFTSHKMYGSNQEDEIDVPNFYVLGSIQFTDGEKFGGTWFLDSTLPTFNEYSSILVDSHINKTIEYDFSYEPIASFGTTGAQAGEINFTISGVSCPENAVNSILDVQFYGNDIDAALLTFEINVQ